VSNPYVSLAAALVLGATAPAFATAAPQAPKAAAPATGSSAAQQATPTRAGVIKNLEATFKAVDTNGDGTLSQSELAAAEAKTQQNRLAAVRTRVEAEFNKLDTNKDGSLSKAEFMAVAPASAGASGNGANLLAELDKNKDGKVSPDEYRAPVLTRFDKLDTNHDGTISPAERQAAVSAAQAQQRKR
jgi:hypothetical protein